MEKQKVQIEGVTDVRVTSYGIFIKNENIEKLIRDNMGEFNGRASVTIIIEEEEDEFFVEGSNKNAKNEIIQD